MASTLTPALRSALTQALADHQLTLGEWEQTIEPIVDSEAQVASADSHAILETWASDQFEVDPQVRAWMGAYLSSRGYQMPDARPAGESNDQVVSEIAKTNVGETDVTFAQLTQAAGKADANVNIAVLDNGFDLWNPELGHKGFINPGDLPNNGIDDDGDGKVDDTFGWDYVDWNQDVINPYADWHGTHVAGIATAGTDQISFIPLRTQPGTSKNNPWAVADAIDFAAAHGAKVLNISWPISDPEHQQIIEAAMERHPEMLFVIAAGNDNQPLSSYDPNAFLNANPDHLPNLCVVAASDETGAKAGFSNFGPEANLAARGTNVLSTIPGGQYGEYNTISGTSMAAPAVVNAAAKCLVLDPALTPAQVTQLLSDTSDVRDDWQGMVASGGPINSDRAVELAGLTGLVRGGMSPDAAAAQLQLSADDQSRLLPLVSKYVS